MAGVANTANTADIITTTGILHGIAIILIMDTLGMITITTADTITVDIIISHTIPITEQASQETVIATIPLVVEIMLIIVRGEG